MRPAREITHARRLNGDGCTGDTHDLTCDVVTAGIRHGQMEALRFAAKLAVKMPGVAWLKIADRITELEKESST